MRKNLQKKPYISILIPTFNEENFIEGVLNNIFAQTYPSKNIEIIVVDGRSDDNTIEIVKKYVQHYNNISFINNPERTVSFALNYGLQQAKGDVIIRMDAHAEYPNDYVSKLVDNLVSLDADNVGGRWRVVPGSQSKTGQAIALATSSKFGIGTASYRMTNQQQKSVDTVPFGCYRRDVFDHIGIFDTDLTRNQDEEFNARLLKSGGRIFLIPSVEIKYFARSSYSQLSKMLYQYGLFKPLVNKKIGKPITIRQFAPPLFVLSIITLFIFSAFNTSFYYLLLFIFFYISLSFSFSLKIVKSKFYLLPFTLIAFPLIHLSYGIGYLEGCLRLLLKLNINRNNVSSSRK